MKHPNPCPVCDLKAWRIEQAKGLTEDFRQLMIGFFIAYGILFAVALGLVAVASGWAK